MYFPITSEVLEQKRKEVGDMLRLDISLVPMRIVGPGDDLFDETEIVYKLLPRYEGDYELLVKECIRQYGLSACDLCCGFVSTSFYRKVAQREGIVLDGSLPGFCFTNARDKTTIYFCAIKDVIAMAKKYAQKEGESWRVFTDEEDAQRYLRQLCEKFVLHELGHVLYGRLGKAQKMLWDVYICCCESLQEHIRRVQSDKFLAESEIPNEAFAEYCEEVLSRGRTISRVGKMSRTAATLMKSLLWSLRLQWT